MKPKKSKSAHTSSSKVGMGDFYGSGVRNKIGKMRDGLGIKDISPKRLSKPPKSLA